MHQLRAIQTALDLIEEHLGQPLGLEWLSRRVGMSLWHFQRTFTAMVGESAGSYIRRRRLTDAARVLRGSDRTILEIAMDYQFDSHEAFTRAFKAELGATPSAWRAGRVFITSGRVRAHLTAASLDQRYRHMNQTPEIVTLPPRTFIGLQTRFISAASPSANNLEVIPELWGAFLARVGELDSAEPDTMYGLCDCESPMGETATQPDEIFYLAGVAVTNDAQPPEGMVTWKSPGGTFVRFLHRGRVEGIGETMGYIHGKWFPESDYDRASGPDFERYDERFHPRSETSVMEIYIPVRPKSAQE